MALISALYLAPHFDPHPRPWYLRRTQSGRSILKALALRVPPPVAVICERGDIANAIAECLRDSGALVFQTTRHSALQALAEFAANETQGPIAFIEPGAALGPEDLLTRAYSLYRDSASNVVIVDGLPLGAGSLVIDRDLLQALAELDFPGIPTEPADLVERLLDLITVAPEGAPVDLQARRFNALHTYGLDVRRLSRRLEWGSETGIRIARRVIEAYDQDSAYATPLGLYLWKDLSVEEARSKIIHPSIVRCSGARSPSEGSPRHVLFSVPESSPPATLQSLRQLLAAIDTSRFSLFVVAREDGDFAHSLKDIRASIIGSQDNFYPTSIKNVFEAVKLLQEFEPDILHLNAPESLPLLIAATLLAIPVVLHVRDALGDTHEEFLKAASAILTPSEFVKRQVLRFDVPHEKVHLIPECADPLYFVSTVSGQAAARLKLGIPENARVVAMLSPISSIADHNLFLDALSRLTTSRAHIIICSDAASDPGAKEAIRSRLISLGLAPAATWLRAPQDSRPILAATEVLVHCGRGEGCERSVVEAMAMGLPVIVMNSGGTKEIVPNGRHIEGGAEELAQALGNILHSRTEAAEIGKESREYFMNRLTSSQSAARLMKVYDGVLPLSRRES
jgi:glycosyltransferase involved in cell wall biosynthesis